MHTSLEVNAYRDDNVGNLGHCVVYTRGEILIDQFNSPSHLFFGIDRELNAFSIQVNLN